MKGIGSYFWEQKYFSFSLSTMSSVYFQLCMPCDGYYDTLIIKGLRVSTRSYGCNPETSVVDLDKIKCAETTDKQTDFTTKNLTNRKLY